MEHLTRRQFCAVSAAATACAATRPLAAFPVLAAPSTSGYALVASVDHDRILRLANKWLPEPPQTITSFRSPRSPGGPHDFFSEADYFWPNPANPAGPYKEIDGRSNPDNFQEHRKAMIRLSQAVPALTAGFLLTRRTDYAHAAAAHLLAWFVTPETRMNPNLEYSQGVRNGGPTGRSYGIIDTLHLVEVARAATFLKTTMKPADYAAVQQWFREYLGWMKSSEKGQKERDATNNHAIAWALQAAEFARLAGDELTRQEVRTRFETVQLPAQEAPDGSFPRELHRTKPYGYSIFQFDIATALGWSLGILAPASGPAAKTGRLSFGQPVAAGPSGSTTDAGAKAALCRGAAFLYPYLADKSRWPYPHDVQHWESWPVRSPGLLFAGLACEHADYIALWRRLDPDPTDPEIIRNYPIRQPLLWVA